MTDKVEVKKVPENKSGSKLLNGTRARFRTARSRSMGRFLTVLNAVSFIRSSDLMFQNPSLLEMTTEREKISSLRFIMIIIWTEGLWSAAFEIQFYSPNNLRKP